jgi:hypothetical protein
MAKNKIAPGLRGQFLPVPNWRCSTTSNTRQAFVSACHHEVTEEGHAHAAANAELNALDAKP